MKLYIPHVQHCIETIKESNGKFGHILSPLGIGVTISLNYLYSSRVSCVSCTSHSPRSLNPQPRMQRMASHLGGGF